MNASGFVAPFLCVITEARVDLKIEKEAVDMPTWSEYLESPTTILSEAGEHCAPFLPCWLLLRTISMHGHLRALVLAPAYAYHDLTWRIRILTKVRPMCEMIFGLQGMLLNFYPVLVHSSSYSIL
jgi:hypothetical protein